jgi:hypothetical protein
MPNFNLEFDIWTICYKNVENWKSQNDLDELCKKMSNEWKSSRHRLLNFKDRCKDNLLKYFSWENWVGLDHFW